MRKIVALLMLILVFITTACTVEEQTQLTEAVAASPMIAKVVGESQVLKDFPASRESFDMPTQNELKERYSMSAPAPVFNFAALANWSEAEYHRHWSLKGRVLIFDRTKAVHTRIAISYLYMTMLQEGKIDRVEFETVETGMVVVWGGTLDGKKPDINGLGFIIGPGKHVYLPFKENIPYVGVGWIPWTP